MTGILLVTSGLIAADLGIGGLLRYEANQARAFNPTRRVQPVAYASEGTVGTPVPNS